MNKPTEAEFTHGGVLQQPHFDNAMKAWDKLQAMTPDYQALAKQEIAKYHSYTEWKLKPAIGCAAQAQQDIIDALFEIKEVWHTGYLQDKIVHHQQLKEAILNYKI